MKKVIFLLSLYLFSLGVMFGQNYGKYGFIESKDYNSYIGKRFVLKGERTPLYSNLQEGKKYLVDKARMSGHTWVLVFHEEGTNTVQTISKDWEKPENAPIFFIDDFEKDTKKYLGKEITDHTKNIVYTIKSMDYGVIPGSTHKNPVIYGVLQSQDGNTIYASLDEIKELKNTPLPKIDGPYKAFAQIVGTQKGLFSKKVNVEIDFGQGLGGIFSKKYFLVNEEGRRIVFNSMIDAMNFMGKLGWKFEQAYTITISKGPVTQNVYHYLLSKDVNNETEVHYGFMTKEEYNQKHQGEDLLDLDEEETELEDE